MARQRRRSVARQLLLREPRSRGGPDGSAATRLHRERHAPGNRRVRRPVEVNGSHRQRTPDAVYTGRAASIRSGPERQLLPTVLRKSSKLMATGTVKWFNDAKGFGFITQDG